MWDEEMWGRRETGKRGWHGWVHVLSTSLANVKRRGNDLGCGRLSFPVFFLFVPHRYPWPTASAAPSSRASTNHTDAFYCLDAFPSKGSVRVPKSLDGCPFSVG